MRNRHFVFAKQTLRRMRTYVKDPKMRQDINEVIDDINQGMYAAGLSIQEAKMIGVRNPAFDGDEIGYPEDDFDDDEDDDKKKR